MSIGTVAVGTTLQLMVVSLLVLKSFYRHGAIDTNEDQLTDSYDYIVVGSGAAGGIVANRLAEDGKTRVLLLEAGGPASLANDIPAQATTGQHFSSRYDFNYTMEPQPVGKAFLYGRIPETRGTVLGGGTSINTMIFNRGNRRDYDAWEQVYGAKGWSFKDVMPYFLKWERNLDPKIVAENPAYHNTDGPIGISSWATPDPLILIQQKTLNTEAGIPNTDVNGPNQVGTQIAQAFYDKNAVRSSTANAYLDPNPYPHNLHILTGSFVTRILFKEKRAVGVLFERKGHVLRALADKEVIVSAGPIDSPKLLMLSGIGPAEHLESLHIPVVKDLPVGDNYQNHPGVNFNFIIKDKSVKLTNIAGALTTSQLYQYLTAGQGPLASHHRTLTYFSTKGNDDKEWPDVNWESTVYQFPANLTDVRNFRFQDAVAWKKYLSNYAGRYFVFTHLIVQRAYSRGYVRLASADPKYAPLIFARFLTDDRDLQALIGVIRAVLQFYEVSSFAEHLVPLEPTPGCKFCPDKKYAYECESFIRCAIEQITYGSYHPAGTVRMGAAERKDTVVDPYLRVKGIDGLRVCDSSIIPLLANANTNAASLMIGEKCADLIKQDHSSSY